MEVYWLDGLQMGQFTTLEKVVNTSGLTVVQLPRVIIPRKFSSVLEDHLLRTFVQERVMKYKTVVWSCNVVSYTVNQAKPFKLSYWSQCWIDTNGQYMYSWNQNPLIISLYLWQTTMLIL